MAVKYIDFNRGNDSNSGDSPGAAWKNLSKAYNFAPGAGGGLYLASDSVWDIAPTRAAHNGLTQTQFNGSAGSPAFITSFDPVANTTGQRPTIKYRMFPAASDWQWDATDNWGYPKGWYIQLDWNNLGYDVLVMVGGQYVGTTNQRSTGNRGYGSINGDYEGSYQGQFVNGMTRNTLRFNMDVGGGSVGGSTYSRLYLSGAGLLSPGAGNDPSSVFGPGQIMIGFRPFLYLYNSSNYVEISGLRCEAGGGLLCIDGSADRVSSGFVAHNNTAYQVQVPFMVLSSSGSPATTRIEIDIRDNVADTLAGSCFTAYKIGIAGKFRRNRFSNGNLCSSMGGGAYVQITSTTINGTPEPFIVEENIADRWKNGTGNNSFDGGCYYIDLIDTGTVMQNNVALNSYVAFQCGNGDLSKWIGNTSVNCEKFGMWNNATAFLQTSDYHIEHNLHIGAPLGTFTHGQDTEASPSALVVTHNGTASNLVAARIRNNVIVMAPGDPRNAANVFTASIWASGKAILANNAFICDSPVKVTCDSGATDKTSEANSIPVTRETCRLITTDGVAYKPGAGSALIAAGANLARVNIDASGMRYYSPPTVGPYEVRRLSVDYMGMRPALRVS